MDDRTAGFEAERPRLLRIAGRLLSDPAEAEDVVQQARLRLDRLRARTPVPVEEVDVRQTGPDPARAT